MPLPNFPEAHARAAGQCAIKANCLKDPPLSCPRFQRNAMSPQGGVIVDIGVHLPW